MLSARILNTACLDRRCNIDTVPDLTDLWRNQISSINRSPLASEFAPLITDPMPTMPGQNRMYIPRYGIWNPLKAFQMSNARHLSKRVESVPEQICRERQQTARGLALRRPFHDFTEVFKAVNVTEPYVLLRRDYQYDVRNITRTEAPADRELNVLQETPPSPFQLEPIYRSCRLSAIRLTTAASYANGNLTDHQALRGYGMADRGHRFAKLFPIIYQVGYTIRGIEEVASGAHTSGQKENAQSGAPHSWTG